MTATSRVERSWMKLSLALIQNHVKCCVTAEYVRLSLHSGKKNKKQTHNRIFKKKRKKKINKKRSKCSHQKIMACILNHVLRASIVAVAPACVGAGIFSGVLGRAGLTSGSNFTYKEHFLKSVSLVCKRKQ